MKAVIQRVNWARVSVNGEVVGRIDTAGLMVLLGVSVDDSTAQVPKMADKIANLRMFNPTGERGGEVGALESNAPILLVSQFTLYGDTRKGRRPSWTKAAGGEQAEPLVEAVAAELRGLGLTVEQGRFGADMKIEMEADGPFTLLVEV